MYTSTLRNLIFTQTKRVGSTIPTTFKFRNVMANQISVRMFAREVEGDNMPLIDKDMLKRELELFAKLPEAE